MRLPKLEKNVITRAVGHRDYVQVDLFDIDIEPGDRYLLCSDGLHCYLDDVEMSGFLSAGPIDLVANALIKLANDRGGRDNITALLVEAYD